MPTATTPCFREPQINAWYVLRGNRVLPLNSEARTAVGAHGTSLKGYQHRVHEAYAARLAGSAYDEQGYADGFGHDAAEAAARAAASRTVGRQADGTPGASRPDAGTLAGVGAAGSAVVLALGLAGLRRMRGRRWR
ncbi:hypothetical protein [Streptomyces sp. NRRL S-1022]|uniref:hypothetical protein n=1 Tax=Streptomyces sp. NRRL S-1022 TaxID=1463880 RepID=UPI0006899FAC|nr:hypothetical protein [Streptomyces sp. NRRL S-1022]